MRQVGKHICALVIEAGHATREYLVIVNERAMLVKTLRIRLKSLAPIISAAVR